MDKIDNSINAESNFLCTGCSVCKIICPVEECIKIDLDENGFLFASADKGKCIQCGECQEVCYKYQDTYPFKLQDALDSYIGSNKNRDIRYRSSSGGVGSALVLSALEDGYSVIGATLDLDSQRVKHIELNSVDEIEKIRGSKYFYSFGFEAFNNIQKNRKYLVIGTPCQMGGLRKYFDKEGGFEDVLLVDFRCFGCAGYNLFDKYAEHLKRAFNRSGIKKINMRSKKINWQRWGVEIEFNDGKKYFRDKFSDLFAISFRSGQSINEVCKTCDIYQRGTLADLRIEDAWAFVNTQSGQNLKNGVSQIGIFSKKGEEFFEKVKERLDFERVEFDYTIPKVRILSSNEKFLKDLKGKNRLEDIVRDFLQTHPKDKRTLVWQYLNTLWYYKRFIRYLPKKPKDMFISIAVFLKIDLKWMMGRFLK